MAKPKYLFYVDFYAKDRSGKEYVIHGNAISTTELGAKRKIAGMYKVVKYGKIRKSMEM